MRMLWDETYSITIINSIGKDYHGLLQILENYIKQQQSNRRWTGVVPVRQRKSELEEQDFQI